MRGVIALATFTDRYVSDIAEKSLKRSLSYPGELHRIRPIWDGEFVMAERVRMITAFHLPFYTPIWVADQSWARFG